MSHVGDNRKCVAEFAETLLFALIGEIPANSKIGYEKHKGLPIIKDFTAHCAMKN